MNDKTKSGWVTQKLVTQNVLVAMVIPAFLGAESGGTDTATPGRNTE